MADISAKSSNPVKICVTSYSWIAYQLEIGAALGRRHKYVGPVSNPRPVLDSSDQTTWGMLLDIVVKPQNELIWPVFVLFC